MWRRIASRPVLAVVLGLSLALNAALLARQFLPTAWDRLFLLAQAAPEFRADDHILGAADATAGVIVFTDYECDFCARLHVALHQAVSELPVRVAYRHFPLAIRGATPLPAEAAECAAAQGRFWEYSDRLFANQKRIADPQVLRGLAADLKLHQAEFNQCLEARSYRERVAADRADGQARRVRGTPVVFINGHRFNGLPSPERLRTALAEATRGQGLAR